MRRCFKKIKVRNAPPKKTEDYELYKAQIDLKILKENHVSAHEMMKPILHKQIQRAEQKICYFQGIRYKKIIAENMQHLQKDGAFSFNDAWKMKKKLFPQSSDAPFAVFDRNDNLVTDYTSILDVMKEEFSYRLRNREINPEYKELQELKEYLCKLRLDITKKTKHDEWTIEELNKAIQKLPNNKCKDPHGHINELYKNMGKDGLTSLLDMLNMIKESILIPRKLNLSNVSTIYKGKGSKQNVVNLRGIFKLPIIRNLLDRLVSTDEQETIAVNMGPYQVGNQKKRNIRDHTLVVHAAVNEAIERNMDIDIQFTDIKQCFDSIWLDEATNDLFDSGVQSKNLNLLYEGNRATRMCVETNYGKSDRVELNRVVMQGSVPGGMICSNQLSKFCNRLYKEGNVFLYRGKIPIPPLAMVDDIAAITTCSSTESLDMNIKTDCFIQRKKLEGQTGDGKCQWIHVGKKQCRSKYQINGKNITQADKYKYLGDYAANGLDTLYKKRCEKAQGYSVTCQAMSTEMSLGYHQYSIAKLLHMSIFINGSLVNMETWPKCNSKRVEEFEKVEQTYLRKILDAHSKTPIESLYLELGIIPLRFQLMKRRILYFKNILERETTELTKQIILAQKEDICKGDFYEQVAENLKELSISIQEVENNSTLKLKEIVNKKAQSAAFNFLIHKAKHHTKVNESIYKNCEGMRHYNDPRFSPILTNLLFKFRTRTYLVKNNFRNNYANTNTMCPLCDKYEDTQQHVLQCQKVLEITGKHKCKYEDIYSEDLDILYKVTCLLKQADEARKVLLNNDKIEKITI